MWILLRESAVLTTSIDFVIACPLICPMGVDIRVERGDQPQTAA